jgi:hypothetical protein
MDPRAIDGFHSLETHHCVTGSMRHIYEFHEYPISEDLLLGLGAGLGFIYWHMKGQPPFIGGRANTGRPGEEGLERTSARRTGVQAEVYHTNSASKAEKALLTLLDAGEPVMVQLDMGFLPYFDFPSEYHFGGHVVVVAGYADGYVLIADRDKALHIVSLDDLSKARGSQFKPFPPQNAWYTFDFKEKRAPLKFEVLEAIREVTKGMLEPPISNLGVKGIRTAATRIVQWPKAMTDEQIKWACFNTYIFIDATGGTGGGIFRYMYGRFLAEAAEITGKTGLDEVGQTLITIGDAWQSVAQGCLAASKADKPERYLPEISQQMKTIAQREQDVWEQLRSMVG